MEINFNYLNSDLMRHMHVRAESALKAALLKGADWEEIKEKENIVTEISIQRHRSERPEDFGSPAEFPQRIKSSGHPQQDEAIEM